MLHANFDPEKNESRHSCESIRDGDWIIFTCPKCPDYERKLNWRTGKMRIKGADSPVSHSGSYYPHEYQSAFEDVN